MGLEGSPDLAHHLLGRIENNHPRAGELLWRHRAQELGADHHYVGHNRGCLGSPWVVPVPVTQHTGTPQSQETRVGDARGEGDRHRQKGVA